MMDKRKTHGMSRTRLYTIWKNMKQRCYNPKRKRYEYYGARGIKVCDEWHDFVPFMEWAMSNGYTEELTIDRIDSDKDYEPSNCHWITDVDNSRAAIERKGTMIKTTYKVIRFTDVYEYDGKSLTVKEWADMYNMRIDTLKMRLKYGWNIERALTQPVRKK
ncbi:HNH endonuclease [Bacillus phage Chotacabras]|nr:HNH endonuclease [Bacillus phage Chotacabras]